MGHGTEEPDMLRAIRLLKVLEYHLHSMCPGLSSCNWSAFTQGKGHDPKGQLGPRVKVNTFSLRRSRRRILIS
jgi:hypothetical protein